MLGQTKVGEKSNEITVIPKLLAMLALEGAIVTSASVLSRNVLLPQFLGPIRSGIG